MRAVPHAKTCARSKPAFAPTSSDKSNNLGTPCRPRVPTPRGHAKRAMSGCGSHLRVPRNGDRATVERCLHGRTRAPHMAPPSCDREAALSATRRSASRRARSPESTPVYGEHDAVSIHLTLARRFTKADGPMGGPGQSPSPERYRRNAIRAIAPKATKPAPRSPGDAARARRGPPCRASTTMPSLLRTTHS